VFVAPDGKIGEIVAVTILIFSAPESSTIPEALGEFPEPHAFACGRRKMQENSEVSRLTYGEM
jgi:hypothetical protein